METACPVCGADVEHVRREQPKETSSAEGTPGPNTSVEIDELCAGEGDEQWDRICHRAVVEQRGGEQVPLLEVYYHHFGDVDEE